MRWCPRCGGCIDENNYTCKCYALKDLDMEPKPNVKNLSNNKLLEEYENTIRYWHYSYCVPEPKFSKEELSAEINRRLNFYQNAAA